MGLPVVETLMRDVQIMWQLRIFRNDEYFQFSKISLFAHIYFSLARHPVAGLDPTLSIYYHILYGGHRGPFTAFPNNGQNSIDIYYSILRHFLDIIREVRDYED